MRRAEYSVIESTTFSETTSRVFGVRTSTRCQPDNDRPKPPWRPGIAGLKPSRLGSFKGRVQATRPCSFTPPPLVHSSAARRSHARNREFRAPGRDRAALSGSSPWQGRLSAPLLRLRFFAPTLGSRQRGGERVYTLVADRADVQIGSQAPITTEVPIHAAWLYSYSP